MWEGRQEKGENKHGPEGTTYTTACNNVKPFSPSLISQLLKKKKKKVQVLTDSYWHFLPL